MTNHLAYDDAIYDQRFINHTFILHLDELFCEKIWLAVTSSYGFYKIWLGVTSTKGFYEIWLAVTNSWEFYETWLTVTNIYGFYEIWLAVTSTYDFMKSDWLLVVHIN